MTLKPAAPASAVESVVGGMLFLGTWPVLNTLASRGMYVAVLATQFGLRVR